LIACATAEPSRFSGTRRFTALSSAASVSFASPTSATSLGTDLSMSSGSSVEWITRLPGGMARPNEVAVKLQPTPNSTSHSSSHLRTQPLIPFPPEPSASGWVSSNALLPGRLVITGMARCSASARSSS
jgi:hypothetical protein